MSSEEDGRRAVRSWVVVVICLIATALPAFAAPVPAVAVPPVTHKMRLFSEIGYVLDFATFQADQVGVAVR